MDQVACTRYPRYEVKLVFTHGRYTAVPEVVRVGRKKNNNHRNKEHTTQQALEHQNSTQPHRRAAKTPQNSKSPKTAKNRKMGGKINHTKTKPNYRNAGQRSRTPTAGLPPSLISRATNDPALPRYQAPSKRRRKTGLKKHGTRVTYTPPPLPPSALNDRKRCCPLTSSPVSSFRARLWLCPALGRFPCPNPLVFLLSPAILAAAAPAFPPEPEPPLPPPAPPPPPTFPPDFFAIASLFAFPFPLLCSRKTGFLQAGLAPGVGSLRAAATAPRESDAEDDAVDSAADENDDGPTCPGIEGVPSTPSEFSPAASAPGKG